MGAGRALLMWSIPAGLFLVAFFHRNAPGVMACDLMEAFGVTGAVIGLLSATYFYSYAGFMIPAGMLIDAFGARRMVAADGAVMGLGTLAMGAAGGPALLFAGRFAVGLGATVTFIGTLKIAAAWFPAERLGLLSAVTATVGVLGALIAAAPLTGFVSDSVVRRRKAPYVALSVALLGVWAVFLGTLGAVPSWLVAALFFGIGVFGGAFVLTWPIGREVNPPELAGIAVAVVNLGGFQGAALTQGPIGAVLGLRPGGHPPEPPAARDARPQCVAGAGAGHPRSYLIRTAHQWHPD